MLLLLPVLLLLFVPQLPAVLGGLFELLLFVLHCALTEVGAAFGEVGDSLQAVSSAAIKTAPDNAFIQSSTLEGFESEPGLDKLS